MSNKYESILGTVGNTPSVRVRRLAPDHVNLYVKIEAFNPMGSVKDRLALGVIEAAEKSGELSPGQTVVEATSGNTGIGLAMVCAAKGYPLVVTMAESFSVERRRLMRFLGAKVVLTPAAEKGTGMVNKAAELAATHGWFLTHQFENEANPDIHSRTTALEILEDFKDGELDYWVTGYGTGGTLKGVSRVLKKESPNTKIVVCEPDNVQLLGSGIEQPRNNDGSPAASHPVFRPHVMQGWTPDFIPKLTEDVISDGNIDQLIPVNGAEAMRLSRELARQEGILVGISAGATLAGALSVAKDAPKDSTILCMLPDTGERYLSTPLFADILEDMDEEELQISKSTPGYRFDISTPTAKQADVKKDQDSEVGASEDARKFLEKTINNTEQPVVMFALEWCEFCWSLRNMFAKYGIDFQSVDLDSVAYQKNNWGGQIRAALTERTNFKTIPQIFIGGEFVGGATDVFDAYKEGKLQRLLKDNNVAFNQDSVEDPYTFLPTWLHPR